MFFSSVRLIMVGTFCDFFDTFHKQVVSLNFLYDQLFQIFDVFKLERKNVRWFNKTLQTFGTTNLDNKFKKETCLWKVIRVMQKKSQ